MSVVLMPNKCDKSIMMSGVDCRIILGVGDVTRRYEADEMSRVRWA